jgi:hypothetical protein
MRRLHYEGTRWRPRPYWKKAGRFAIPTDLVRVRDALRLGSHRPQAIRTSNTIAAESDSTPFVVPPNRRGRRAACRSVAIRQEAKTVDSQSRMSTVGALSKGHRLCRSLTATESRRRTAPCANRSVSTRMTSWRGTAGPRCCETSEPTQDDGDSREHRVRMKSYRGEVNDATGRDSRYDPMRTNRSFPMRMQCWRGTG